MDQSLLSEESFGKIDGTSSTTNTSGPEKTILQTNNNNNVRHNVRSAAIERWVASKTRRRMITKKK